MQLYSITDYREVMNQQVQANAQIRGYRAQMAAAARFHPSFLSQILKGNAQLTLDQAALLCDFWRFSELDSDYFVTLVTLDRAGTPCLQSKLEQRLAQIRQWGMWAGMRAQDAEERLSMKQSQLYFSAWYWTAIRSALNIPELNTAESIAARFSLPLHVVNTVLTGLEEMDLVARVGDTWCSKQGCLSLVESSELLTMQHQSFRLKAMQNFQMNRGKEDDGMHVTIVGRLSREDFTLIKKVLNEALDRTMSIAEPSPSEIVFAICLDFISL